MRSFMVFIVGLLLVAIAVVGLSPEIRGAINTYIHELRKIDESTDYDMLRKVEDTCRAMQASYEADRLMYEQYKDSDNEEKQSWAEQAKMRANKTAATYNQYILENSYLWRDNVPADIRATLNYLDAE